MVQQKLADHYFIACRLSEPVAVKRSTIFQTNIQIIDKSKLDKLITSYNWNELLNTISTISVYDRFVSVLQSMTDSSKKSVRVKQRNSRLPWISNDILVAIAEKNALWQRSRRSPKDKAHRDNFRIARNGVSALIRSAKRTYYSKQFENAKRDAGKVWSLVNELRGSTSSRSVVDVIERAFGSVNEDVANIFNSFFASHSSTPATCGNGNYRPTHRVASSAFLPSMTADDLTV